jgi:hypothetical protein
MQLHLLKMFSFNKQAESLNELKSVLLEFYRRKVDEESAKLWENNELSDDKIEEILYSHNRTPYQ